MNKIKLSDIKKTMVLEKKIERKDIVKEIKRLFPDSYAIPKPIRPSVRGVPDRMFCINGRLVAIEVKRDGGVVAEKQLEHIDKINKAGGLAFVAYSMEEVREVLIKEGLLCSE